jgi:hypothetical protein
MADPYVMSFTILDTNGVKTSTPAYYAPTTPSTVTVANLIADWTGLGDALDPATNGQIVGGRILIPVEPAGGWKSAPVEENDTSDQIILNFRNAATRYAMEFALPVFLNAMLTGGKVDLSNALLTALYEFIVSGALHGSFSNTAGQDLTALRDAFQTDRKSRKLRTKSLAVAT